MSSRVKSFVSWLDSLGVAFHTNDAEKRKTTILIRACFLTGFFMILYIGNCFFIDFTIGLHILPFESLIFFSIPLLIKQGLKPKIAAHLFILNGTAFGILLVWFSGGLQSPVTPWLTLMPICAILFMDARNAWIWAFIILGIVLLMGGYWQWIEGAPKNFNESRSPLYFLNCYAGLIFIYLLLSLIFEKRLNATIYELEASQSSLRDSNNQLNQSLETLKVTQSQLIQAEKMASLGELTAGIAHEIQNPLNFVNNFSEVNKELIDDIRAELIQISTDKDSFKQRIAEIESLLGNLESNQNKINHHGSRADAIVKGMLAHSRTSSGKKEPTNLNALAEEYLRLSYYGLKAKDASFSASFEFKPDNNLPIVNVVAKDFGRVLLNLMNNAFYAVQERMKSERADVRSETTNVRSERADVRSETAEVRSETANVKSETAEVRSETADVSDAPSHVSPFTSHYQPKVTVTTKSLGDKVEISVKDNGSGIPESIKEKIFQPFFTTKPAGEGTGLGLSLSYDIVKAHGGELTVESQENFGTIFNILLPK